MKKVQKRVSVSDYAVCSLPIRNSIRKDKFSSGYYEMVSVNLRPEKGDELPSKNLTHLTHFKKKVFQDCAKEIIKLLCEEHPQISTYKGIYGGRPHINGIRLSVTDILSELVLSKSIENVLDEYNNVITEEQAKEAIRFARDFLEFTLSVE